MQHYFENIYYNVICSLVLQVLDSLNALESTSPLIR